MPHESDSTPQHAYNQAKIDFGFVYGYSGNVQRRYFYFMLLVVFVTSLHTTVTSKLLQEVEHWCAKPDEINMTMMQWLNVGIPIREDGSRDPCKMRLEDGSEVTCTSWVYRKEGSMRGLRDEFDLVCHRRWMTSVIDAVYFIGCITSDPIMGNAADSYGRHIVMFTGTLMAVVAGFALLFVRELSNFLLCRFVIAIGIEGVYTIGSVLLIEVADASDRTLVMVASMLSWGIGYLYLWFVGALVDNWILIHGTVMIPTLFLCVGLQTVIESPRWLLALDSFDYLELVVFVAARKNATNLEVARERWNLVLQYLKEPVYGAERMKHRLSRQPRLLVVDGYLTMLLRQKNQKMLKAMAILWLSCLVNVYLFFVLWLSLQEATQEWKVLNNDMCAFFADFGSFFVTCLTINRFGRPRSSAALTFLAGSLALPIMLLEGASSILYVVVVLMCTMFLGSANCILRIHTLELNPTVVRGQGYNYSACFGRLGAILAAITRSTTIGVPAAILSRLFISGLCLLNAALLLWLPDTHGRNLPDNFDDVEDILGSFLAAKGGHTQMEMFTDTITVLPKTPESARRSRGISSEPRALKESSHRRHSRADKMNK
ncbi:organic cation/carnitine transporter 2-like [Ornithodoros turicata]|uniref:organic cation/carnitine transporter 2-like n=1 Tax=Ornithodoros turicata TaxID=34597 RepID=UPI0031396257